ncbi:plasmid stabilization protein [Candidatus Campbellbacteria bacterium CG22_combo_CG10-13_8_21_14_all_36_13]|uniref:Plasmid stabilization protein n=1 Tax=Candidatus Campbellbacteria bacterium CG22_combo_CG10-13_8_21_14_all_36_13 TaxID=1974529 RepID=A0A2H0DXK4_9BACT|nr:MAG: plasmid stabilization protein [Candidatus Campbellbacteria bacterium CG22_combo_CG10-13_8_21_14_all_36_13]
MNKLDKFLSKLDKKTRYEIEKTINVILGGDFSKFDIKKLKGKHNLFRVRVGKVRIVFKYAKDGNFVQSISFRNDTTYNL